MERRSFLGGLLAAFAAPALPVDALEVAAPIATAPVPPAAPKMHINVWEESFFREYMQAANFNPLHIERRT